MSIGWNNVCTNPNVWWQSEQMLKVSLTCFWDKPFAVCGLSPLKILSLESFFVYYMASCYIFSKPKSLLIQRNDFSHGTWFPSFTKKTTYGHLIKPQSVPDFTVYFFLNSILSSGLKAIHQYDTMKGIYRLTKCVRISVAKNKPTNKPHRSTPISDRKNCRTNGEPTVRHRSSA